VIESAGIVTISMSNIPDLTETVGVPRLAAIEYPLGRTLGMPGDEAGQLAVLRAVLDALVAIDKPGKRVNLPFEWPQSKREARAHPKDPPPISAHLRTHPWQLTNLLKREIPE